MKNKTLLIALVSVLVISGALATSSAYAQGNNQGRGEGQAPRGSEGRQFAPGKRPEGFGTSTKRVMPPKGVRATSTNKDFGGKGFGLGQQSRGGLPGVIASIGSASLTMTGHGAKNATTTFTVNVTSATSFHSGSTTIALSDLSVGERIIVVGKLATSTNTIDAKIINVMSGNGKDFRGFSSTTLNHFGTSTQSRGMFDKIGDWFKGFFGRK
jgi:hypothetical protein